jgi:hypothetical protein
MDCPRLTWLLLASSLLLQVSARAQGTSSVQLPQKQTQRQITLKDIYRILNEELQFPAPERTQAINDLKKINQNIQGLDANTLTILAEQFGDHMAALTEKVLSTKPSSEEDFSTRENPVYKALDPFPKALDAIAPLGAIAGSNIGSIGKPGLGHTQLKQAFQTAISRAIHEARPGISLSATRACWFPSRITNRQTQT